MRLPVREEIIGRDWTDGYRGRGRTSALCFSLSHSPSVKDVADDSFPSVGFFHTDINNTVIKPPSGIQTAGLTSGCFSSLLFESVLPSQKLIKSSTSVIRLFSCKIFRRKPEQPPSVHTTLGSMCISVAGVKLRSSLSEDLKQIESVVQLKNK